MRLTFTKLHGCGNDYVYVDCTREDLRDEGTISKKVSDRHFGIGSDGLILIRRSDIADFRMSMYNADGSEGAMCGNGIRCVGKYVYDHGLTDKETVTIETKSGIKELKLGIIDGKVATATVDMGKPVLTAKEIPAIAPPGKDRIIDEPIEAGSMKCRVTCVSMGNPHCITFVEETEGLDLEKTGPLFEHHPMFPDRVNTEFIKVIARDEIRMRVWERGSGETLACGTGACAAVVACVLNGLTDDTVTVHLLGGDLKITYDRVQDRVLMEGPATEVFSGEMELD